jgi:stage II sporulation protein D
MRRLLVLTALLTMPVATADGATRWVVKGGGWGHGIGMSQYGAYGQALEGRGYRKIVRHYYRGTRIGQARGSVRVLLLASVGSSTFTGATRVGSKPLRPRSTYVVVRRGGAVVVRTRKGKRVARGRVLHVAGSTDAVTVAGKGTYRDEIEYRPGASGGVTAINVVELEKYIRGVVPRESPSSWPLEALKAQAVAARSYALSSKHADSVFDHYDTAASQVYGGRSAETARTDAAVARTDGQVLRYRGAIAKTFFHSTSGGHTENNENVFTCPKCGGVAYLRGVPDPWDRTSPYHRWRRNYTAAALGGALGVGKLRSVDVTKQGVSGRIVWAVIRGRGGRVRLHGWNGIKARLGLLDAPEELKRIGSRASAARAAAAGVRSRGFARDVAGRIVPARTGTPVRVERLTGGGWKRAGRGRIRRGGHYRVAVETAGTYRVVSGGDAGPAIRVR